MKVFCLLLLIALAGVANCQIRRLQAEPAPRFIGENGEEVEVAPEEVDRVNRLNAISTVLMENAAEGIEVVMHGDRVFTRTGGGDEDDPRMKLLNLPAWYADISEPVERDSNGTNVTSEQAPCPKIHGPQFIFPVSAGQTRTIRSSVNPRAFDAHNWKLTSLGRMRLEICEIQYSLRIHCLHIHIRYDLSVCIADSALTTASGRTGGQHLRVSGSGLFHGSASIITGSRSHATTASSRALQSSSLAMTLIQLSAIGPRAP